MFESELLYFIRIQTQRKQKPKKGGRLMDVTEVDIGAERNSSRKRLCGVIDDEGENRSRIRNTS